MIEFGDGGEIPPVTVHGIALKDLFPAPSDRSRIILHKTSSVSRSNFMMKNIVTQSSTIDDREDKINVHDHISKWDGNDCGDLYDIEITVYVLLICNVSFIKSYILENMIRCAFKNLYMM